MRQAMARAVVGDDGYGEDPTVTELETLYARLTGKEAAVFVPSGVMANRQIGGAPPNYPAIARSARLQGTVVLQATIGKDGTITNLRVISGPALLQQSAVSAVRRWRYKPMLLDGVPIDVETTISVDYSLN